MNFHNMKNTPKQLARELVDLCEKGEDVHMVADALVALLQEKSSLGMLRDVMKSIETVWKDRYGAATITVVSAHPLNAATRTRLEQTAKGAQLIEDVDVELIGGASVRIDDRIIDGSIKGHLDHLKQVLNRV